MNDSITLLKKVNWFLQPVQDTLFWLMTTTSGKIFFWIFLSLYFVFTVLYSLDIRRMFNTAGKTSIRGELTITEYIYLVFSVLQRVVIKVCFKIPMLIGIFVFLLFIGGMSSGLQSIDQYIEKQNSKDEYNIVVRHLTNRYKIADIRVLSQSYGTQTTTKLSIKYNDEHKSGMKQDSQVVSIYGSELIITSKIINFEVSDITSVKQIVLPWKIHTNEQPEDKAFLFDISNNKDSIPYYFYKTDENIFGIEPATFKSRLKELMKMTKDEKTAKKYGITITGYSIKQPFWKDFNVELWMETDGTMILKKGDILYGQPYKKGSITK